MITALNTDDVISSNFYVGKISYSCKMRFLVSWLHYFAQLRIMPVMFLTIDPCASVMLPLDAPS